MTTFCFYAEPAAIVGESEVRRIDVGLGHLADDSERAFIGISYECDYAPIELDRDELGRLIEVLTGIHADMGGAA